MPTSAASSILDCLPAQLAVLDRYGIVREANRAWLALDGLGCPRGTEIGGDYLADCDVASRGGCARAAEIADGVRRVLAGQATEFVTTYPHAGEGRQRWYQVMIRPVPDDGGAVVMHVDVTALQQDPLTGLANRALFFAQLDHLIARRDRARWSLGLLMVDLDHFKSVNDVLGHPTGDELLVQVAKRLRDCVRAGDLVARLGGDEFAVLLTPLDDVARAEQIAERVVSALRKPFRTLPGQPVVGASAGLAVCPQHGETSAELFDSADRALYRAKAVGRACYRLAG